MRQIFHRMLLFASLPALGDSQWSISFDLGIPDLIGTRIVRHNSNGSYIGVQPGFLVTLPAHYIAGNNTWAFTPGLFLGNDIYIKRHIFITGEINITHGMSWGKYDDGGGFLVAPRCGLSIKRNHLLVRILGGVTIVTIETLGFPSDPRIFPSFLLEGGFTLSRSGWRLAETTEKTFPGTHTKESEPKHTPIKNLQYMMTRKTESMS